MASDRASPFGVSGRDLTHEQATNVHAGLSRMVGDRVKVAHLESEAGLRLNGLEGTVVSVGSHDEARKAVLGGPPFRVNVQIDGVAGVKRLRSVNLVPVNVRSGQPGQETVPSDKARALMREALRQYRPDVGEERQDIKDRMRAGWKWVLEGDAKANAPSRVVGRCGVLGRPPPGRPCFESVRRPARPSRATPAA